MKKLLILIFTAYFTVLPVSTVLAQASSTPTPTSSLSPATVRFIYDGEGVRVAKVENGNITYYFGDYFEKESQPNQIRKYYSFQGRKIAQKINNTLNFLSTDQLHSISQTIDANGNKQGEVKYYPYGQVRTKNGILPSRLYTGQISDASTGLLFYNSRFYNPETGQFISPDQYNEFTNLGNRYGYVGNNPLARNDPSGHFLNFVVGGLGGAILGAIVGAGASAISQYITEGKVDLKTTALAAISGGFTGGCLGATAGAGGALCTTVGQAAIKCVAKIALDTIDDTLIKKEPFSVEMLADNAISAVPDLVADLIAPDIGPGIGIKQAFKKEATKILASAAVTAGISAYEYSKEGYDAGEIAAGVAMDVVDRMTDDITKAHTSDPVKQFVYSTGISIAMEGMDALYTEYDESGSIDFGKVARKGAGIVVKGVGKEIIKKTVKSEDDFEWFSGEGNDVY